jgi:hypothetical protein
MFFSCIRLLPLMHAGFGLHPRYVLKLYMNGHFVDTSQPVTIGEDFIAHFKDVFRRVVSIMLRVGLQQLLCQHCVALLLQHMHC